MNSNVFRVMLNIVIIFGITGTLINLAPNYEKQLSTISVAALKIANPILTIDNIKAKYGTNNINSHTNNTNGSIQQTQTVMRPTNAKDCDADTDITKTPQDIISLMEEAKTQYNEGNMDGKTTEDNYFGGGELVKYNNVEIQSKIPNSFYPLNIENLLNDGSNLKIKDKSKPTILIYHSHTTEAYSLLDTGFYDNANSRSNDANKSVVRVGDEITRYLEAAGYKVIHDREIHDTKYGESYDSSKESIQKYLEEYPSIEITIDVHRDTITYSNKTKVKPTAIVNDKKAARMMIISGCEYGRVKNFPTWEQNLKFNLSVQQKLADKYPGLMRPVMFSERKYNMNMTPTSFLLEVGTDANTLEEACYSGRLFGQALGELLNEKYKEDN